MADTSLQKTLVWGAVILGGGFLLYKLITPLLNAGKATVQALNTAGDAIGSGLYDLFNPPVDMAVTFYAVTFPNGKKHAIDARIVFQDGTFTAPGNVGMPYIGQTMQLVTSKSDGTHYALATG